MITPPPPLKIDKPLVFGDKQQIDLIRDHERATERAKVLCGECEGEGEITCPSCDGTGEDRE